MLLGTPEMFTHLEPYNFTDIPGFEAAGEIADLKLEDLTDGSYGAHAFRVKPTKEALPPTPWHVHDVDFHLSVFIRGWIRIELEGVGEKRIEAGQLYLQPPRIRHRELEMSPDILGFEITRPAKYKTTFFIFDEGTETYNEFDLWL